MPLPVVPIFLSAELLDVHRAQLLLQGHTSEFLLFKSIDCDVLLQDDMHSVRHEQAILDRGETLLYQCGHLREEAWTEIESAYRTPTRSIVDDNIKTYTWKTTPLPMKLRLDILASDLIGIVSWKLPVGVNKSTGQKVEARCMSVAIGRLMFAYAHL